MRPSAGRCSAISRTTQIPVTYGPLALAPKSEKFMAEAMTHGGAGDAGDAGDAGKIIKTCRVSTNAGVLVVVVGPIDGRSTLLGVNRQREMGGAVCDVDGRLLVSRWLGAGYRVRCPRAPWWGTGGRYLCPPGFKMSHARSV